MPVSRVIFTSVSGAPEMCIRDRDTTVYPLEDADLVRLLDNADVTLDVFNSYENFDNAEDAIKYLKEQASFPTVLKADGLFMDLAYEEIKEYHALHSYVEEHYQEGKTNCGIGRQDLIQVGGVGSFDRVAILIGVITETIHNQECYGFFHRKTSYTIHLERKRPPIRTAFYCCAIKINHTVHAAGRAHKALRAPNHMNQTGCRRGMSRCGANRNVIAGNAGGKLPQTSRAVASSVTKTRAPRQCFANKTRGAACCPLGPRATQQCYQQNSRRVILPREGPPATAGRAVPATKPRCGAMGNKIAGIAAVVSTKPQARFADHRSLFRSRGDNGCEIGSLQGSAADEIGRAHV